MKMNSSRVSLFATFQPSVEQLQHLCFFSELQEKTPAVASHANARCVFKGTNLTVITPGGQEFVVPFNQDIVAIHPIADGIIIQALHLPDQLYFQPQRVGKPSHSMQYSYFTLSGHPLNDLHPLGYQVGLSEEQHSIGELIDTPKNLLFCSPDLSFVVMQDSLTEQLEFMVLKEGKTDGSRFISEEEAFLSSLLPSSRHPTAQLASNTCAHFLLPVWQITSTSVPDQIFLSKSLGVKTDLYFQVFYKGERQVALIKADLEQMGLGNHKNSFKVEDVIKNALNIATVKMVPDVDQNSDLLQQEAAGPSSLSQVMDRVSAIDAFQLVVQEPTCISVYYGVHKIAVLPGIQAEIGSVDHLSSASSYITLTQPSGSSTRLKLSADCLFEDSLLASIISAFKHTLPHDLFLQFYFEVIAAITKEDRSLCAFEEVEQLILQIFGEKQASKVKKETKAKAATGAAKSVSKDKASRKSQISGAKSNDLFQQVLASDYHLKNADLDFDDLFDFTGPSEHASDVPMNESSQFSESSKSKGSRKESIDSMVSPLAGLGKKHEQASRSDLPEVLAGYPEQLFKVLHYLYEDHKLSKLRFAVEGQRLAKLLIQIVLAWPQSTNGSGFLFEEEGQGPKAKDLSKVGYLSWYLNDFPYLKRVFAPLIHSTFGSEAQIIDQLMTSGENSKIAQIESVPSIVQTLGSILQNKPRVAKFRLMFKLSYKYVRALSCLATHPLSAFAIEPPGRRQSAPLQNQFMSVSMLDDVLLRPKPKSTHEHSGHGHPFEQLLFVLLQEGITLNDISQCLPIVSLPLLEVIRYCRLFLKEVKGPAEWPQALYEMIGREDVINNRAQETAPDGQGQGNLDAIDDKFMTTNQQFEVGLEGINQPTSQPAKGHARPSFLLDHFCKDSRYIEACHLLSSSKEMTLKVHKVPNFESLPEEQQAAIKDKLNDKQFVRQLAKMTGRGLLYVGTQETIPTEMLDIPKINNVSYIPLLETTAQVEIKDDMRKELLQWPQFHNGAAQALQVAMSLIHQRQHDPRFIRNWIMQHKPATPRADHAGFLLSLGVFGMLDSLQKTDIYQHLKSIHDLTAIGILIGRAASKIGSMDTQDTKSLCMHISYLVPPNLYLDISLPVQSAALIGTGLLYKGTQYRQITEMLLAQIGRKPINDKSIEREVYALSSGLALGFVNLGAGPDLQVQFADLHIEERLFRFIDGGPIMEMPRSTMQAHQYNENNQCSSIKEGDQVNVHITSSGALYALCFIYLQSNSQLVADKLKMPQSFHELESVRPAFLLQKVLCRNLIMWDQIQASQQWVQGQLPEVIDFIVNNNIAEVEKKYSQQIGGESFDFACISLCHTNILTGAYLSIGYKYAGTGNMDAFNLINEYAHKLRKAKIATQMSADLLLQIYTDRTKNLIDKYTQENCLVLCALAMSLVMAGTGNSECFKTIRVIRKRLEQEMHFGHNMAINMALGLLFLGSGSFSLSRSRFSIACLMCALYPVFPRDPNDNRFHLQALRHFSVMAIESRLVQARDIDSGEYVQVELALTKKDGSTSYGQTPVLVDEEVVSLSVHNDRYYPLTLKLQKGRIISSKEKADRSNLEQAIFIKKKNLADALEQKQREGQVKIANSNRAELSNPEIEATLNELEVELKNTSILGQSWRPQLAQALMRIKVSKEDDLSCQLARHFTSTGSKPADFNRQLGKGLTQLLMDASTEALGGQNFFELQDAADLLQTTFSEQDGSPVLAQRIKLAIGVDQVISHDRLSVLPQVASIILQTAKRCQRSAFSVGLLAEFHQSPLFGSLPEHQKDLYASLSSDQHHLRTNEQAVVSKWGLQLTSPKQAWCLSPFTMQVCFLLCKNFLNQLKQQGEQQLVQQFAHWVLLEQEQAEANHALGEILKSLCSITRVVIQQNEVLPPLIQREENALVKSVVVTVVSMM